MVVVASGLSPSGPIHLGDLREVMTPHLVADETRCRGYPVRHLISWDDYDRYRKVPNAVEGVDDSWAEHFKAAMIASLDELGVAFGGISQTEQYKDPAQELKHQKQKQRKPVDGAEEDEGSSGAGGYYPYKPYCGGCGKDFTTLTSYADETTEMAYTCTVESCCFSESRS